ncbi:MAG: helix-turn-helix domain-containing protein [Chloroflexi bacterium]|nr:helix-turn-helix domain-containing protein [Chloroflexota bacterium]
MKDVCQILGATRNTIKKLIRDGILPAYAIDGIVGYRFKRAEVESLIKPVDPRALKPRKTAARTKTRRIR